METAVERRAARRFSMMLPVKVRFEAGNGVSELQGETRDVSFRGLYFLMEAAVETGSSIEFVLTLPQQITLAGDVHIRCYARVFALNRMTGAGVSPPALSVTNFFPPQPDAFERFAIEYSGYFPRKITGGFV